ncbi:hypothetical protein B6U81_04365 [Thermoplasmatales archaeon ex4484_30]|nr:MAG: hypothetical protein B6U81_04365 [Thermoplasmatales archaeon ex4484_30]
MKAKIWTAILVMGVLLGTSAIAGVNNLPSLSEKENICKDVLMTFSKPEIKQNDKYVVINAGEGTTFLHKESYPILPYKTEIMTFPFGTKIKGIEVKTGEVTIKQLDVKIQPAPKPVPFNMKDAKVEVKEGSIYQSNEAYPANWVEYNTGAGIKDGKHVIFLSIHAFPYRYIPAKNELMYTSEMKIKVNYEPPEKPLTQNDVYDLVIIAPSEFSDGLQPLVQHKENHGVKTLLATLDDIYGSTYFPVQGRDGAEKIKYFIKDAIEQWGIKYVLLVGGKKSFVTGNWGYDGPTQVNDDLWYVPVRYAALDDQAEKGYLSDLYFADIYDANGNFSSWDSNGDGIYAAWSFRHGKDVFDGYPDVYVGRLACRNTNELQTVVNKIITYESQPADPSWFNKMLLVGGDTFNSQDGIYEGEYSTEHLFSFMPSQFQATKLFASDGTLSFGGGESKLAGRLAWMNVIPTFSQGFGFVAFDGHGSPTAWATHFPNKASHDDPWLNGLMTYNMDLLSNGDKLPIVSVGGCHNSEFNISLTDFSKNPWTYQPTYECWSWHLVKMAGKGSIATLGYTGLGYGAIGDGDKDGIPDCVQYLGGYIEGRFFKAYGQDGKDILGEAWGQAVTEYINKFPPMEDRTDCKTIEEWCLLGDPSLKIGGYS